LNTRHIYTYLLTLLFILPAFHSAKAQLTANFSSSVTQGCATLSVQFTDQSAGNPSEWFWDFGNGTNSTGQNPVAVYADAGVYTVKLFIKNGAKETYIEKKNYITVFATPVAGFDISNDSGCIPLNVTFTDTSLKNGATISSWLWNFGDGNTSAQQNPVYTYTSQGIF